ncbi:hypothetical protein K437DRAFT_269376 [Tilletiaria anomala UBC 951]|uniref:Transcription initiation factor IIE subunit alpha N-terminal domain-containing protein n=1 Tax=Tilletiaria anomala (strain ATCC 24038 / CBS 436.72 / UBC 951) TaxID=1037660 RepID=A0A066VL91_TILAU|nr:uncharacterized protein K437DRAFT_269376 [Tilletiaria anomala UBC 951]KDN42502.1 hypothetical protein K437DRAFT_269376 [Tilletiaria anomala UBC 951]
MLQSRRPHQGGAAAKATSGAPGTTHGSGLSADGTPLRPASQEDLKELKRLCQVIVRMFYEDHAVMIMDQLAKFDVIDAVMLARRLAVGTKDLKAQSQKLLEDRLISIHSRYEQPERDPNKPPLPPEFKQRMIKRSYYYLDLPTFFSVVKWRVLQIYKSIDSLTSSVSALTKRGYICPQCHKTYDSFDVAHLLDFSTNTLRCDVPGCFAELELDEDKETAKRKEDKMQGFNQQFGRIMAGLRKLEGLALPEMNVEAWLVIHASVGPTMWKAYDINDDEIRALATEVAALRTADSSSASNIANSAAQTDSNGLAISRGATNSMTRGGLSVDVSAVLDPASEAARLKAAEEAARQKRAQNALPEWHLESTVSGEATALGLKEQRRRAAEAGVDEDGGDADGRRVAQMVEANAADATAEYYAALRSGAGSDNEDEDEEDEFIEVDQQPAGAPLAEASAVTVGQQLKRPAPSEGVQGGPDTQKKAKPDEQNQKEQPPPQMSASPANEQANDEEEEEFEEV